MAIAFVSDFGPLPLLQNDAYAKALTRFGSRLKPKAIIIMSGHWQEQKILLTGSKAQRIIYDYGGFPPEAYAVQYPVQGAPEIAAQAVDLLLAAGMDAGLVERGLDHGAWVPLYRMFPKADVSVVQISATGSPEQIAAIGKALVPLAHEGVLLLGAGALSHNFSLLRFNDPEIDKWALEFNAWINNLLESNAEMLFQYRQNPLALRAAPTTEHFDPLFFVLGAAGKQSPVHHFDRIQHGNALMKIFSYEHRI